jgi:uncharacterized membrane protein
MMKEKKSKYDTNPLDEEHAKRADEAWGEPRRVEPLPAAKEHWPAEAPTKRYDHSIPVSYPSINVPPSYPVKQPPARAATSKAPVTAHAVPGLGLPENVTLALPYAPFFIGAVAGAVELFLTPRSETRVRSNAAQALVLQLATVVFTLLINTVGNITGSRTGGKLLWAASTFFFIFAMVRALKGKPFHIPATDEAADWIDERISPQKLQKRK